MGDQVEIIDRDGHCVDKVSASLSVWSTFVSERYHSLFLVSQSEIEVKIKEYDLGDLSKPVRTLYEPGQSLQSPSYSDKASDLSGDESGWIMSGGLLLHPDHDEHQLLGLKKQSTVVRLVRRLRPDMWQTILTERRNEEPVGEGTGLVIFVHRKTGDIRFVTENTDKGTLCTSWRP